MTASWRGWRNRDLLDAVTTFTAGIGQAVQQAAAVDHLDLMLGVVPLVRHEGARARDGQDEVADAGLVQAGIETSVSTPCASVNQTRLVEEVFGLGAVPTPLLSLGAHRGSAPGRPGASLRRGRPRFQAHSMAPPASRIAPPASAAPSISRRPSRSDPGSVIPSNGSSFMAGLFEIVAVTPGLQTTRPHPENLRKSGWPPFAPDRRPSSPTLSHRRSNA